MPVRSIEATDDGEQVITIRIADRVEASGISIDDFWDAEATHREQEGYALAPLPEPIPYRKLDPYIRSSSDHFLLKLANIAVSDDSDFPTYVLTDVWNDCQLFIELPDAFVSYEWGTAA